MEPTIKTQASLGPESRGFKATRPSKQNEASVDFAGALAQLLQQASNPRPDSFSKPETKPTLREAERPKQSMKEREPAPEADVQNEEVPDALKPAIDSLATFIWEQSKSQKNAMPVQVELSNNLTKPTAELNLEALETQAAELQSPELQEASVEQAQAMGDPEGLEAQSERQPDLQSEPQPEVQPEQEDEAEQVSEVFSTSDALEMSMNFQDGTSSGEQPPGERMANVDPTLNLDAEAAIFNGQLESAKVSKAPLEPRKLMQRMINRVIEANSKNRLNGGRFSIAIPMDDGPPVRLVITPQGNETHRLTLFSASATYRDALKRAIPELESAASELPLDVAEILVEADERPKKLPQQTAIKRSTR